VQVIRLTPSGLLPAVALSELALAPPNNPGEPPRVTGRYCWALYHGEPGPQQWRARIALVNPPFVATRVNMAMALFDYEFKLLVDQRKHADGKLHERPKLGLVYERTTEPDGEWLVLCDPMPPFGCRVHFQTVGAITQVDAGSASYGAWAVAQSGEEVQRFPMPIYHVRGDGAIRWLVVPMPEKEIAGLDLLPIEYTGEGGFLGSAVWDSREDLWKFRYDRLSTAEVKRYVSEFRSKHNGDKRNGDKRNGEQT